MDAQQITYYSQIKNLPVIDARTYGVMGIAGINYTSQFQTMLNALPTTGVTVALPLGESDVCNVNTTNPINFIGMGPQTLLKRHSSCIDATSDLLDITTTGTVSLYNFKVDQAATGATFSKDAIFISGGPSKVWISNMWVQNAQVDGILCQDCSNVVHTNNYYYHCGWFGVAFSTSSPTSAPVYKSGFVSSNNNYVNTVIGEGYNFFLTNISVSNETFTNSGLAFIQMPNAQAVVSNIILNGIASWNPGSEGTSGIFEEGVTNISLNNIRVSNITATLGGGVDGYAINCQGSQLTIPGNGTTIQLPCSYNDWNDVTAYNISNVAALSIAGTSFNSSTVGVYNSINNYKITNSVLGATITGSNHVKMSNFNEDNLQVGADTIAGVTDFTWGPGRLHNVGVAASTSYSGLILNTSLNGWITGVTITNDVANVLYACVYDQTYNIGTATQIKYAMDNNFTGCASSVVPVPSIPTIGTWQVGDILNSFTVTPGTAIGWFNTSTSSHGIWYPLGILNPDTRYPQANVSGAGLVNNHILFGGGIPSLSSGGGSGGAVISGSTDNKGVFEIGTGSSTAQAVVAFATAFTGTPTCSLSMSANLGVLVGIVPTLTSLTINFTAGNYNSTFVYWTCF